MNVESKQVKARGSRIAHIESHLEGGFDISKTSSYITTGQGDVVACLLRLRSHALASAMHAWFVKGDIQMLRQWSFVAARLYQRANAMKPDASGPYSKFLQLLLPLLSNNAEVIDWNAGFEAVYDAKRVQDHRTMDFLAYQGMVALRRDWAQLTERAERVLADPVAQVKRANYLPDYRFYLALGRGDISGMEEALAELVSPKLVQSRSDDESGYTDGLISTPAVILAKLAWRSGYPVRVESPFVPAEWLLADPLPEYKLHYDFLQ